MSEVITINVADVSTQRGMDYVAIAEQYFQKKCLPDEVVHHIDGDHSNNDPENLVIMKRSQHSRLHAGLMGALDKWRENVTKPLCRDCLYARIYKEHRGVHDDLVIDSCFTIFHFDKDSLFENAKNERQEVLDFCEGIYSDCVSWRHQHDHDCYANKNMHAVKQG